MYMYIHTYRHAYIHIYIYIHTYIHVLTHERRCRRAIRGKENIPWYKIFYVFAVPYTPPAEPDATPSESTPSIDLKRERALPMQANPNMPLEMMAQNSLQQDSRQYPSTSMYPNQVPLVYFNQGSGGVSASTQYPVASPYGQPSNAYLNYPPVYVGARNFGNEEVVTIDQTDQNQVGLFCHLCWLQVRSTFWLSAPASSMHLHTIGWYTASHTKTRCRKLILFSLSLFCSKFTSRKCIGLLQLTLNSSLQTQKEMPANTAANTAAKKGGLFSKVGASFCCVLCLVMHGIHITTHTHIHIHTHTQALMTIHCCCGCCCTVLWMLQLLFFGCVHALVYL
jgi:hypothetical protein